MSKIKFLAVPVEVLQNERLSIAEKMLLSLIITLEKQGRCFASDCYFSRFLATNKKNIQRWLKGLRDKGFVRSILTRDGKRVSERTILVNYEKIFAVKEDSRKDSENTDIPDLDCDLDFPGIPKNEDRYAQKWVLGIPKNEGENKELNKKLKENIRNDFPRAENVDSEIDPGEFISALLLENQKPELKGLADKAISIFFEKYQLKFHINHPELSAIAKRKAELRIIEYLGDCERDNDLESFEKLIDCYFGRKLKCDYHLSHFLDPKVFQMTEYASGDYVYKPDKSSIWDSIH